MAGFCEHGNEPSGFIKGGEFLDSLSEYQLLKGLCSVGLVTLIAIYCRNFKLTSCGPHKATSVNESRPVVYKIIYCSTNIIPHSLAGVTWTADMTNPTAKGPA